MTTRGGGQELMGHIFDACDEEGEDKINFRHFAHCLSTVFRGTWEETMEFWCARAPVGDAWSLEESKEAPLPPR
jgi:hypothetical protein